MIRSMIMMSQGGELARLGAGLAHQRAVLARVNVVKGNAQFNV